MKRTIASVLVAIMTILCIGGGYSESDALSGGIEAEEIILDQLPEPEQESEEDMATGDKLVNLDDLKVAYDKQQEDTNALKSAFRPIDITEYTVNTFVLGNFYKGTLDTSATYRMSAHVPLATGRKVTCDWSKYVIVPFKHENGSWTGTWKTSDFTLDEGDYWFVVNRSNWTTTPLTEAEQAEIQTVVKTINTGEIQYLDGYTSDVVKFRRYLTSSDNVFAIGPGVYGIPQASADKPSNLPSDFDSDLLGYLVVMYTQGNTTLVSFAIEAYTKRMWLRSGYDWMEFANYETVYGTINPAIESVYDYLSENVIPDILKINTLAKGNAVSTNKTQYKWINHEGEVKDIGTSYSDWYITDEITITPSTFYYITASARSSGHLLYAVYDNDGNVVQSESSSSWDIASITEKLIYTTHDAKKIRIASVNGSDGAVLFLADYRNATNNKWADKKWVCIGDSLTAVNATASEKYHNLIANKTGINVVNLGVGGTGYKKSFDGNGPFMDRVSSIPLDSDVVTVFGSGNDGGYTIGTPSDTGTDTLCGCINTTIGLIFDRIPTCHLGVITPTPWGSYNPADDTNWMAQYSEAIVEICKRWGVPCLDLYHCSNLRPWVTSFKEIAYSNADGVHPNNLGHSIFAPMIESFLDSLLLH